MTINFIQHVLGSSLPAHGWVGARATSLLAAHFALRNTASNSAEKKGSPSEGVAEGGGWGRNSATPEPKRSVSAVLAPRHQSKTIFFQFFNARPPNFS